MCQIHVQCWERGMNKINRDSMPIELCLHHRTYTNMAYMVLQDEPPNYHVSFISHHLCLKHYISDTHVFIAPCTCHVLSHLCDFLLLTLFSPLPLDLPLSMHSLRESLSLTHSDWVKYSSTVFLNNTYIPHHCIYYVVNICVYIYEHNSFWVHLVLDKHLFDNHQIQTQ